MEAIRSKRYHVIFDLNHCGSMINDDETLMQFVTEIIAAANMKILAGPVICEGVPENPGLTCFAVLDFSHASIHTFTNHQEALIDVFSCKLFDKNRIRELCMKAFATPQTVLREKEVWWG